MVSNLLVAYTTFVSLTLLNILFWWYIASLYVDIFGLVFLCFEEVCKKKKMNFMHNNYKALEAIFIRESALLNLLLLLIININSIFLHCKTIQNHTDIEVWVKAKKNVFRKPQLMWVR